MKRKTVKYHQFGVVFAAALSLCLVLQAFGAVRAKADVIYEPGNSFYETHREECTFEDDLYECNVNGGTKVYLSPESDQVVSELKEVGELFQTACIYTAPDGTRWACGRVVAEDHAEEGWVPYDYLWKCYKSDMFTEDYGEKIGFIMDGCATADDLEEGQTIYFYRYPGGPEEYHVTYAGDAEMPLSYCMVFIDEEERMWAHIGYYYGHCDWCCLSATDLSFDELFPNGAPERDLRPRIICEVVGSGDPGEPTPGIEESSSSEEEASPSEEETGLSEAETNQTETVSESLAETTTEDLDPAREKEEVPIAEEPIEEDPNSPEDSALTYGSVPVIVPAKKSFPWWIAGTVGGVVIVSVFLVLLLRKKK